MSSHQKDTRSAFVAVGFGGVLTALAMLGAGCSTDSDSGSESSVKAQSNAPELPPCNCVPPPGVSYQCDTTVPPTPRTCGRFGMAAAAGGFVGAQPVLSQNAAPFQGAAPAAATPWYPQGAQGDFIPAPAHQEGAHIFNRPHESSVQMQPSVPMQSSVPMQPSGPAANVPEQLPPPNTEPQLVRTPDGTLVAPGEAIAASGGNGEWIGDAGGGAIFRPYPDDCVNNPNHCGFNDSEP